MEPGGSRGGKRRRGCLLAGAAAAAAALLLVVAVVVAVAVTRAHQRRSTFEQDFRARCEKFSGYDCQKIWGVFQQAYVGRDPCNVPMGAYDPLVAAVPYKPACNRMMFWSKTKEVVHDFTEERDCYVTLEDTLLGSVLDGLTWCGREGSSETLTTDCPAWSDCDDNPVRSFWNRVSAAFAESACGDVTAMLNGSIATPFSPTSVFGSIEVKRFNSTRMRRLTVVLATQANSLEDCSNPSLKDLQKELDKGIQYSCKEVPVSQLLQCNRDPEKPCGPCW